MIPIGDDIPTRAFPFITVALIAANILVFLYELSLGGALPAFIFGNNGEDRCGHFKYLAFYLAAGFVAMGVHVMSMPYSPDPAIGASGAIAGVLGAYLVMFPRARVFIVIPLFLFFPVIAIRAVFVLGFWFVQQLINGVGAIVEPVSAAGGAW